MGSEMCIRDRLYFVHFLRTYPPPRPWAHRPSEIRLACCVSTTTTQRLGESRESRKDLPACQRACQGVGWAVGTRATREKKRSVHHSRRQSLGGRQWKTHTTTSACRTLFLRTGSGTFISYPLLGVAIGSVQQHTRAGGGLGA